MGSKYDDITTAAELVAEVAANGLSMEQEDLNRVASIIDNTPYGELIPLANNTGQNGEPGTQDAFYRILFAVWHWGIAVKFFEEHTHPINAELSTLRAEKRELDVKVGLLESRLGRVREELEEALEDSDSALQELDQAACDLEAAQGEIVILKARLYDMISADAGQCQLRKELEERMRQQKRMGHEVQREGK